MNVEPPVANDAEQNLIGATILDNGLIPEFELDHIPPEAFYSEKHRIVWKTIQRLYWNDTPIDLPNIIEELRKHKQLEASGGAATLIALADLTGIGSNAPSYARNVLEAYRKRSAINVFTKGINLSQNGKTFQEIADTVERELHAIHTNKSDQLEIATELAKQYLTNQSRISTGFRSIDELTGGLPIGDLTILAGRTSMGKSALAHAIAFRVGDTHVFTPDQPLAEIMVNRACKQARVPFDLIKKQMLKDEQKQAWLTALDGVKATMKDDVTFDERSVSTDRLYGDIKRQAKKGKKLIIVDHLQKVNSSSGTRSRREHMIELTGMLKDTARDYGISILALSQLSRDIDERDRKVPMLSDLSESKSIEEDANLVLFLYRDQYYNPSSSRGQVSDVIMAKNKTGRRNASAQIWFDDKYVTFTEVGE